MQAAVTDVNPAQVRLKTAAESSQSFGLPAGIATGMRWTLWLSILALPFSYGTNILLARIGPEALGTFGVLNVYIAFVMAFFFIGGCAVPMKFLPELTGDRRSSFFVSYSLILFVGLTPWWALATLRPQLLRVLFGYDSDPALHLLLIYLSPICLAYVLMSASLKAILEMKWGQILDRGITVGMAAVLLTLFICNRTWLIQHATGTVWFSYLAMCFIAAMLGLYRLVSVGSLAGRPHFWVPPRFWPYTLLLQSSSILNFLNTRLDYLFVLNGGGLTSLGSYVAITSIAGVVPRISGFVVDSLLPSLTNCLAAGDVRSTAKVAGTYLRLMLLTVTVLSFTVVVFVRPVLAVMGPLYLPLAELVQIASIIAAVQSLNLFISTIFTATDHVHHDIVARVLRTITFAISFWPLWTRAQLLGAVISWGLGEVAYQAGSLYLVQRNPRLHLPLLRSYVGFVAALVLLAFPARYGLRAEYISGALALSLPLLAFLTIARYTVHELRSLACLITNARACSPAGG